LDIAQHPGANVGTLYNLVATNGPFQPTLTAAPNDWTAALEYTIPAVAAYKGGGVYINQVVIDASQNVWTMVGSSSNAAGKLNAIFEFGQDFTSLSPASGYTDSTLNGPYGLAFDLTGNLWIANTNASNLTEYASNGTFLKSVTGGGVSGPAYVAVDKSNNVWVANFGLGSNYPGASEFTNAGVALSGTSGYSGAGVDGYQQGVAIDASGDAWFSATSDIGRFAPGGVHISGSAGYSGGGVNSTTGPNLLAIDGFGKVWTTNTSNVAAFQANGTAVSPSTGYTGGGLASTLGIAVDGAERIWVTNGNSYNQTKAVGVLTELNNDGSAVSPSTGYVVPAISTYPYGIAVDGAGNMWESGASTLLKVIGVAAPVVTPLSVATATGKLGQRP
jgi:hypothetical protein